MAHSSSTEQEKTAPKNPPKSTPPGSGSNEKFENINRAILFMPQIEDIEFDIPFVYEFEILDYSDYPKTQQFKKKLVTVQEWQSFTNQQQVAPDIILYLIAPQMQFIRLDTQYLKGLIKYYAKNNSQPQIIFVFNTFYKQNNPLFTQENIEDVCQKITEIYQS